MNLSQHFTLAEATFSAKAKALGVENIPDEADLKRMRFTADGMERVRKLLGGYPIKVNSWFRGEEVNKAVGGVKNSQHALGEAVDFTCAWFGTPKEIAIKLRDNKDFIKYDQLIFEQTWVHISFTESKKPRGKELTFTKQHKYVEGIV
jgi:hypothetical protein